MILNYRINQNQTPSLSRAEWIAKLQEGFKSNEEVQKDLLEGVYEDIKEILEESKDSQDSENAVKTDSAVKTDISSGLSIRTVDVLDDSNSTVEVKA